MVERLVSGKCTRWLVAMPEREPCTKRPHVEIQKTGYIVVVLDKQRAMFGEQKNAFLPQTKRL
jgi:hypothetical protein